jgi:hypothetical protein
MVHHAGANHVQVNVYETAMQVLIGLKSRGMISVFPERSLPPFTLVIFLRAGAGKFPLGVLIVVNDLNGARRLNCLNDSNYRRASLNIEP